MPHIDTLSFFTPWTASGQSRFARPVAAITSLVQRFRGSVSAALDYRQTPVRPGRM